jgi:F-type H+-transporting ATPase subunit alpha
MPVEEQCVVIFAGTRGYLDDIDTADVRRFEDGLLEWFHTRHAGLLEDIRDTGDIADEDAFDAAVKAYAEQFVGSGGPGSLGAAEPQPDADTSIATGSRHLPEEQIDRDDEEGD